MPADKYNTAKATHSAQAWTALPKAASAAIFAAGIPRNYISTAKSGRSLLTPELMGQALDALKAQHPTEAERLMTAYLLDSCPTSALAEVQQLLQLHPIIRGADPIAVRATPEPTPAQVIALANIRALAHRHPAARDAILLIAKHI